MVSRVCHSILGHLERSDWLAIGSSEILDEIGDGQLAKNSFIVPEHLAHLEQPLDFFQVAVDARLANPVLDLSNGRKCALPRIRDFKADDCTNADSDDHAQDKTAR